MPRDIVYGVFSMKISHLRFVDAAAHDFETLMIIRRDSLIKDAALPISADAITEARNDFFMRTRGPFTNLHITRLILREGADRLSAQLYDDDRMRTICR